MKLKNFIVTKAKPRIFWKPVQMSTVAENKMKDSKKFVEGEKQSIIPTPQLHLFF